MCALWGARFSGSMAPSMVPLNRSLGADFRLWPQDIAGSKAWARALAGAGVLTSQESSDLVAGLERVAGVLEGLDPGTVEDEDVHSAAATMEEKQVRRLLVLNRTDRCVGIVSIGDLAVRWHDQSLSGEVLEKVSQPTA